MVSAPPFAAPSAPRSQAATITVEVAYSPRAGEVEIVSLQLPMGATAADALRASGLASKHGLDETTLRVGVWCKAREATTLLRDRDRVEVYRPLRVDPKEARRQRYKRHLENARAKGRPVPRDEAAG
ncbi:MAG: RnfH family protein [Burkholderiales bacterium]|nr:RnfH family protein [Burkholderiales bacterium]